jgi:hypothetical protein
VANGTRRARRAGAAGPVGRTGVADGDAPGVDGAVCFVTDGNAPRADEDVSTGGIPFPGGDAADDHGDTADGGAAVYNRTGTPIGSGTDVCSGVDCAARASACPCASRSDTVRRSATAASDECTPDDRDRDADNRDTNQRTASQHNHTAATTSHQHAASIHQHIDQPANHKPVSRPCWRWIRTR